VAVDAVAFQAQGKGVEDRALRGRLRCAQGVAQVWGARQALATLHCSACQTFAPDELPGAIVAGHIGCTADLDGNDTRGGSPTSDAAATHAYLRARIAERQAAQAMKPAAIAALGALEGVVRTGCPGILVGAPPHAKGEKTNESVRAISDEPFSMILGTPERVEHAQLARFARTVGRLRWSNPRLTRLLHSLALEQDEQSAIPYPDLCSDLRFWVASGYSTVSTETQLFLRRQRGVSSITTIEDEPGEPIGDLFNLNALVARRLRPYENHADRLLARKALPPEGSLAQAINAPTVRAYLEASAKVYAALGGTAPRVVPPGAA
jgi:hypothetical protein